MARARITHHYPEGGYTTFDVEPDRSYPDEMEQAIRQVLSMYHEVVDTDPPVTPDIEVWIDPEAT